VTKRKASLSTVMAFMSEEAQDQVREQAGVVSPLPLQSILPDPAQPRQLLPQDLAGDLVKGVVTPAAALEAWRARAAAEDAPPALKRNVHELGRLADSIAQHGLINPISVRHAPGDMGLPADVKYLIITGERRYWAHVLLTAEERAIQEGVETSQPNRIKATIASEGISVRAHQIVENLLREDIDAVEKANGFKALRWELSGRDPDKAGAGEVNHGSPLVSWQQVEKAVGVSKRYRIYVTSVLKLSSEAKTIISQHGLTERMVRPVSQKLRDNPDLQLQVLNKIVSWQKGDDEEGPDRPLTAAIETLVDNLVARHEKKAQAPVAAVIGPRQLHTKVRGVLRTLDQLGDAGMLGMVEALNSEANKAVVADLQALEQRLDELLEALVIRHEEEGE